MVWQNGVKGVSEIFSIDTENFKLWATLTPVKSGKSKVHGWVTFDNGEKSCFSGEDADRTALRKRALIAFGPVAAFYGSELVHRKIQVAGKEIENFSVTTQTSHLIHLIYNQCFIKLSFSACPGIQNFP